MAEISFESLLLGLSAGATTTQRGTATTTPTHNMPFTGSISPRRDYYRPEENRGHLAEFSRSRPVRDWSEWEGEGPLDNFLLPVLLNMALKGGVTTPTTPSGATSARLWAFNPTMTADDLRAATLFWGDPNTKWFRSVYNMIENLTISADASGTDGATMSVSGFGRFPTQNDPVSVPPQLTAPLITPAEMQLWLDTSSAIGTTEISGRFISAEFSHDTGIVRKHGAVGPTGGRNFIRTGRGKRHAELSMTFELLDMAQYDIFQNYDGTTPCKIRWRLNGPEIEDGFYHYVQTEIYGPLEFNDWGDLEGTNRTIQFTVMSQYDVTAGHDFNMSVQNTRTTL